MIGVELKGLIEKCNGVCVQMLHAAAGLSVNRGQYEVTVEHVLLAGLDVARSDMTLILEASGTDTDRFRQELNVALETFRFGNSGRPVFSPLLQELLEAAWLVASVDLGQNRIRTGALLLAFLKRPSFYAQGGYASALNTVNREDLQQRFAALTAGSDEIAQQAEKSRPSDGLRQGGESFIAKFCEDFSAKARDGKLDPVFGRDPEIRQMVDILARRRKNNPILVGEPGVGKTAVMEGLALRIVEGDVPDTLKGVTLLGLDLGLLEAGASIKGEFERRLKGVLDEIKSSSSSIVLFIDEAHLLVGAGSPSGGSDAANLMKPALARGEIRTCAATTWKEYKKYFEKDPALARRFQLVKLDEPSVATTALILRGLRPSYEAAHKVMVRDDALEEAAELAGRYISGRFLPDKAVDLLDTACARVKVSMASTPAPLEDCKRAIQALERERNAVERDMANGMPVAADRLSKLAAELESRTAEAEALDVVWKKEFKAAQAFMAARDAYAEAMQTGADLEAARHTLDAAREALVASREGTGLLCVEVDPDTVAKVVSDWTGIPVGKMARDQAASMINLESVLQRRIQGQDMALAAMVEGIQASKAGLRSPNQPTGVFLLVGPSGVGKTETGLALADALFGDERNVIIINMSEFQEKHTVSRLVGSPPGYVGYGEGGLLTEAVRRKPYAVVLLDEVEKAHLDVMQLFYQVFDKGVLTDGEGVEVNFRNTLILLTSNLASDIIQAMTADNASADDTPDHATVAEAIRPVLSGHFQPALLARMQVVPFISLRASALGRIAGLKLNQLRSRLKGNSGMELRWSDQVVEAIVDRCTEVETGARNIDYILSGTILPRLAREILSHMGGGDMPTAVDLNVDEFGNFAISFEGGGNE